MKNNYESPELTVISIDNQDILTASAGDTEVFSLF